jgi:hypothetical protein
MFRVQKNIFSFEIVLLFSSFNAKQEKKEHMLQHHLHLFVVRAKTCARDGFAGGFGTAGGVAGTKGSFIRRW